MSSLSIKFCVVWLACGYRESIWLIIFDVICDNIEFYRTMCTILYFACRYAYCYNTCVFITKLCVRCYVKTCMLRVKKVKQSRYRPGVAQRVPEY